MKNYSTSKVFVAACIGMAFFGVTMLSLAPILGPLNESVQGANALPSTMSIGIIIGTILFGPLTWSVVILCDRLLRLRHCWRNHQSRQ